MYTGEASKLSYLLHFSLINRTGNGRVGRIVATAAAKHLTPITLEVSLFEYNIDDSDA